MKNNTISDQSGRISNRYQQLFGLENVIQPAMFPLKNIQKSVQADPDEITEILFITSYPPRECGIATYSQDLIKALNNKFSSSLSIKVCALESGKTKYAYPNEVKYILNTSLKADYDNLAIKINNDRHIDLVMIQHEFGFYHLQEQAFLQFLAKLTKPILLVFHTVLPNPGFQLKENVQKIAAACDSIIVMTNHSAQLLKDTYGVPLQKISIIAHGTHLVPHLGKKILKEKYDLKGRKVLTTFGLLSSGKSIETTLAALPSIIKNSPDVMFLIIGKTHPEVVKAEGEKYRQSLEALVTLNKLEKHVRFINSYLALPELLEYLQLTDIYLFTTNDPNQAVSGTFVYAMSCGCPIISTPIPHAKEVLTEDTGIIFDFCNSGQLSDGVIKLLNDNPLRKHISSNTLQKIVSTAWENSAVAHVRLFDKFSGEKNAIEYNKPAIKMDHLLKMTTNIGIIQFSKINQPDICTGYTLDDNARALVASCLYYKTTHDEEIVYYIDKYLRFVHYCQQTNGDFLNYVDRYNQFTNQNQKVNLDDSNGRAVWALGFVISLKGFLPDHLITKAEEILKKSIPHIAEIHSTRAMAFNIKGLYYYYTTIQSIELLPLIKKLAERMVQMYKHEANEKWRWFEDYLTYANSILPEAMLYAWLLTGEKVFKEIARSSLSFLLSQTFNENGIEVISNKNWLKKGEVAGHFGEQPIDVAYTIMTLSQFFDVFKEDDYFRKMETAFNWFLGKNRLHQIIYNPCTGGCYDGLEENHVNLNQGAESTASYLMARFTIEKYREM